MSDVVTSNLCTRTIVSRDLTVLSPWLHHFRKQTMLVVASFGASREISLLRKSVSRKDQLARGEPLRFNVGQEKNAAFCVDRNVQLRWLQGTRDTTDPTEGLHLAKIGKHETITVHLRGRSDSAMEDRWFPKSSSPVSTITLATPVTVSP